MLRAQKWEGYVILVEEAFVEKGVLVVWLKDVAYSDIKTKVFEKKILVPEGFQLRKTQNKCHNKEMKIQTCHWCV